MWRQTIFYPYLWALQFAQGTVLDILVQSPTYAGGQPDPVPYVDATATVDPESGKTTLFLLNRDLVKPHQVDLVWEDNTPSKVLTASVITGTDLKAVNSFESPQQVHPQPLDKPAGAGNTFELPPRSYSVIQMA